VRVKKKEKPETETRPLSTNDSKQKLTYYNDKPEVNEKNRKLALRL